MLCFPLSTDILNSDFRKPFVKKWLSELSVNPKTRHAKFWEQAMIAEALKKNGMLQVGKKGFGFGVGREQLVSLFAASGVDILATDQAPDGNALDWNNGQLANGKASLYYPKIIDKESFEQRVNFMHHDMNTHDPSLDNSFDFTWSNCVIGHLGSMALSEKYLYSHGKYLKDGGISVITTELNISSLDETVDRDSGTIIWRLRDLERVCINMLKHDMVAEPFVLRLRKDHSDDGIYFDIDYVNPRNISRLNSTEYMTKIPFSNYAITPIQLIFHKKTLSPHQSSRCADKYRKIFAKNEHRLRRYQKRKKADIGDYAVKYDIENIHLPPQKEVYAIRTKSETRRKVRVGFKNTTSSPFFSYGFHTPLGVQPLVVSTDSPVNRDSDLYDDSWFSANRPSVGFAPQITQEWKIANKERCHGRHRTLPGELFTYTFIVKAPRKSGVYEEPFCLLLEGAGVIKESRFIIRLRVE